MPLPTGLRDTSISGSCLPNLLICNLCASGRELALTMATLCTPILKIAILKRLIWFLHSVRQTSRTYKGMRRQPGRARSQRPSHRVFRVFYPTRLRLPTARMCTRWQGRWLLFTVHSQQMLLYATGRVEFWSHLVSQFLRALVWRKWDDTMGRNLCLYLFCVFKVEVRKL